MEKNLSLYVIEDKAERLDNYISEKTHISRTYAQKLIEEGNVTLNDNKSPKSSSKLKQGDILLVHIPASKPVEILKENIPVNIIHEDEHIVVVNKERGMVVHPAAGNWDGTLVNALLYHIDDLDGIGDEQRPGIVHRLDKNTSGLMVVAKTEKAHHKLMEMFKIRTLKKEYIAILHGRIKGREGIINLPIGRDPNDRKKMAVIPGGKSAITRWKLKKCYNNHSIVLAELETGRTHQLRVHFRYLENPIVGDPEYAGNLKPPTDIIGQALHSYKLGFLHPVTGKPMEFIAPLPQDMEEIIDYLEKE